MQTSTKKDHYTRGVPPEISQLCPVIPRMVMDRMQVSCSQVIRSLGQGSHLPDTHVFNGIKPGLHESSWWMDRITYMFVYIILYYIILYYIILYFIYIYELERKVLDEVSSPRHILVMPTSRGRTSQT